MIDKPKASKEADNAKTESSGIVHVPGFAQERQLLSDLKKTSSQTKDRLALHVHLDRLAPESRSDHALRAAETTFKGFITRGGAAFYWFTDSSFVVLFKAQQTDSMRSALVKIRFLFAGDPLLKGRSASDASDDDDPLVTWINLDQMFDSFLEMMKARVAAHSTVRIGGGRRASAKKIQDTHKRPAAPLTPDILKRVDNALSGADLSSHIRRQPVFAIVGQGSPDPVFTEVYVSIGDLRDALIPHVDLSSNVWLFQKLTQTLDRRVLSILSRRDDRTLTSGFSINLNVNTILSDEFLRFDEGLSPGNHGTVILELRTEDIFSNLTGYFFARDYVRQRGYRICIDGLNWQKLPYINIPGLGADMAKMCWQPDLPDILASPSGKAARRLIETDLYGRVILNRCDNDEAIDIGQNIGFTLFQGRALDKGGRVIFS